MGAIVKHRDILVQINEIEARQKEINELQKYIGQYGKTRDVYAQYRATGWSRAFYNINATSIIKCKAAKKHINSLGYGKDKKLPGINSLRQEWAALDAEKRKMYAEYKQIKQNYRALATAKVNADYLLFDKWLEPKDVLELPNYMPNSIMGKLQIAKQQAVIQNRETQRTSRPSIGDSR